MAAINQKEYITIKGAKVHNLKNVDVKIPKNELIAVTGVSGSGKSSLIFDTLYAEGQRRYVESLSSYARQFLMRMNKPEVDYIKGIAPAIAIEQKINSRSSRSTVGSFTEIYDYLRLLYARVGKTYSPISNQIVKKHEISDVVDFVNLHPADTKAYLIILVNKPKERKWVDQLSILEQNGFSRLVINKEIVKIEDALQLLSALPKNEPVFLLIDRFIVNQLDESETKRIADSVQTAFDEGNGSCGIQIIDGNTTWFSNKFEADGIQFEIPTPQFFSFNNSYGACATCEGTGMVLGIDHQLVFPNKTLSVFEEAIAPWRGEKMKEWKNDLVKKGIIFNFPIHRSIQDLTTEEYDLLWKGNKHFRGLNEFFKYLESEVYKIQYRVMLSRYKGKTTCAECKGSRIRKDAAYVKIGDKSIGELMHTPIDELQPFFDNLKLTPTEQKISKQITIEIKNRIVYLLNVGLHYLTLDRPAATLSGGETQRIQLTRVLGSNLTSSLYILDEPSVGLHPRDTKRLTDVLENLRDMGNTVIVVEHEEEVMRRANHIIDMGPMAGTLGGEIIFEGDYKKLGKDSNSLTAKYLNKHLTVAIPKTRRTPVNFVSFDGCRHNNLQNLTIKLPLQCMAVVTGVSGSGKSTLIQKIVYPALMLKLFNEGGGEQQGIFDNITGDYDVIKQIELIDQNPLGKSSRSNPVTYLKAFDDIRNLYANQHLSKIKGLSPGHFSFNVDGGRCDTCKGDGEVVVEMQFLADIHLPCEDCNGQRFKSDILEVTFQGKNIFDVLAMTVDEAMIFFTTEKSIFEKIKPLQDVGLGYITLGQSSSTLSGGEAQRVKLSSFLGKGNSAEPVLFIFDEPTTGLHFHDINKLLTALNALVDLGHSVLIIEHNMEIIKNADYIIDLGPDGGKNGGQLVFAGTPEQMIKENNGYTANYLKNVMA
jgi:excinuclease ABC subunit A